MVGSRGIRDSLLDRRGGLRRRTEDWILDGSGLVMQGAVIPVLQILVADVVLSTLAPSWRGAVRLDWWAAFLINFVVVDYAYYWNHRLLHTPALWRWHAVHHTAAAMDVLVTSRNTLWTNGMILYLWVNGLGAFLLANPTPYLAAAALTAALDLWRHSAWTPRPGTSISRGVALILVTPRDHAWHHSASRPGCNFGANLGWWDRLHGTAWSSLEAPPALGIEAGGTLAMRLLWPPRPRTP